MKLLERLPENKRTGSNISPGPAQRRAKSLSNFDFQPKFQRLKTPKSPHGHNLDWSNDSGLQKPFEKFDLQDTSIRKSIGKRSLVDKLIESDDQQSSSSGAAI